MPEPLDGETAIVLQLLFKLRALKSSEATALLRSLQHRGPGSSVSLDEFVAKCNRQIASSGMQVHMSFDGETSSLALRCSSSAELPKGDQVQKTLNRLLPIGDADAACSAAIFETIMKTRTAVSVAGFVDLCATYRVPSAPKLLRCLLDLRWLASEAPASEPEKRQLTLGPGFYLEVLPHIDRSGMPVCALCKQPAFVKLKRCSSCSTECHASCVDELRVKVQGQPGAALTCCSCNAAWEPE